MFAYINFPNPDLNELPHSRAARVLKKLFPPMQAPDSKLIYPDTLHYRDYDLVKCRSMRSLPYVLSTSKIQLAVVRSLR